MNIAQHARSSSARFSRSQGEWRRTPYAAAPFEELPTFRPSPSLLGAEAALVMRKMEAVEPEDDRWSAEAAGGGAPARFGPDPGAQAEERRAHAQAAGPEAASSGQNSCSLTYHHCECEANTSTLSFYIAAFAISMLISRPGTTWDRCDA